MLPGRGSTDRGSPDAGSPDAGSPDRGLTGAAEARVAAEAGDAGRTKGRDRAAAQVTPIEDARNLRIRMILGTVILICISRT
ncbi:hypothetical protein GCM10010344_41900 [Streptomyces bluensis]|nr:hypothetical protein GCM10010344_41900 [Streptomyces bluensis]